MKSLPTPLKSLILFFALGASANLGAQSSAQARPAAEGDEIVQYLKSEGAVYGAIVRNSSGAEIRRETYIRDGDGNILEIVLRRPDGTIERVGASGAQQWVAIQGSDGVYRTFNPDGTLKVEEDRSGAAILKRETYSYSGQPPHITVMVRELPGEGARQEMAYGLDGLLIRETRTNKDGGIETLLYAYDSQSRVTGIRKVTGRSESRKTFAYAEDGSETEESFDTTGALVLRTTKYADGSFVEEHYDAGRLFARNYFKDGRKVREEIISNGEAVRTRESP
jgi:hypothetical protein